MTRQGPRAGEVAGTSTPLRHLAHGVRTALRVLTAPLWGLLRWWRRSIQARVVISVLALSTVLAFLAGWVLMRQVVDGVLSSKQQTAISQAAAGTDTAQARLGGEDIASGADVGTNLLNPLVKLLAPRDQDHLEYAVVIIGPLSTINPGNPRTWAARRSAKIDTGSTIPSGLVAKVQENSGSWWAYSQMALPNRGQAPQSALVVGSTITVPPPSAESFGLFYVFPLTEQQQTMDVVGRALLVAGALLVVLLGTIAWVVTRQVVTPVRLARRIAERLAGGRLEERMHVRGEDDLARLGSSFNQMAASLQKQIRQLEELSRVQQRFVSDVSHELRTPLTTVRMASDVLHESRDQFDPVTARSAELLHQELDRFESLLTDLMEISRFDAGAAVLDLHQVDMADLARRVVSQTSMFAGSRGSQLRLQVPDHPSIVQADVRRVERIARNLITNAVQYGQGGPVDVRVQAGPAWVSLTVRDRGVGLRSGEETLVFNRFWRADPARARTRGGTGLGLAISAEDARLHGGTLDAWGRPGRGSIFRLTLPLRAGEPLGALPALAFGDDETPVGTPYAQYGPQTPGGGR